MEKFKSKPCVISGWLEFYIKNSLFPIMILISAFYTSQIFFFFVYLFNICPALKKKTLWSSRQHIQILIKICCEINLCIINNNKGIFFSSIHFQHSFRWYSMDLKVKKWKMFFQLWHLTKPEANFCISTLGSDSDKSRTVFESTTKLYSWLVSLLILLFHPLLILVLLRKYFTFSLN